MTQDKSTPRPWHIGSEKYDDWGLIRAADGMPVADTCLGARHTQEEDAEARRTKTTPPTVEANATLIVSAVNSFDAHKECVEALKECLWFVGEHESVHESNRALAVLERARVALAKLPATEEVA